MHNKFKQQWFSCYSLVTTQLYFSNNLGLVKIKEQHINRFSTIKSNRKKNMHTSVAIKRNEKPLNWKRGYCYSLIIQEIY